MRASSASSFDKTSFSLSPRELDDHERFGLALNEVHASRIFERFPREVHDHFIDELDSGWLELENLGAALECGEQPVEVEHRERRGRRHWDKLDSRFHNRRERPFGAHDDLGQVDHVGMQELVEVVTAHPPRNLRVAAVDLAAMLIGQRHRLSIDGGLEPVPFGLLRKLAARHRAERDRRSVREDRFDFQNVLDGLPVYERASPGGVVPDHATKVGAIARRRLGTEAQPIGL